MHIFVFPIHRLGVTERRHIADHLTRPGSEFQQALVSGSPLTGVIATMHMGGEIVSWARTYEWREYQTLEAFTASEHRRGGLATACTAALIAYIAGAYGVTFAVFRPQMASIAARLRILHRHYARWPDGSWQEVQE